jgi:SAM-dependent methyltransferase
MNEITSFTWLGCPICQGQLDQTETGLHCQVDTLDFPLQDGIFRLLPPEEREAAAAYGEKYRQQREAQGWPPLAAHAVAALPDKAPAGWDSLYWPVRQQSYQAMLTWLETTESAYDRPLRIAVMGAGFGWLAGRLSARGHQVAALDLSTDDAFGLGAAREMAESSAQPPLLVQGDMDQPPLRPDQVDLVVYSASVHYAIDLKACLQKSAVLLRSGGALVITDTPVLAGDFTALPPEKGQAPRRGRQVPLQELEQALTEAGFDFEIQEVSRGFRWSIRQWRIRFFGGVGFSLPLIVAQITNR